MKKQRGNGKPLPGQVFSAHSTKSTDTNDSDEPGTLEPTNQPTTERSTPQATTPTTTNNQPGAKGDVPLPATAAELVDGCTLNSCTVPLTHARLPGEGRNAAWERIRKSLRAAGFPRGQGPGTAYDLATREVERLFPPPPPEPEPIPEVTEELEVVEEAEPPAPEPPKDVSPIGDKSAEEVSGLGDLPESWGVLPANASLQAEIAWVSANRLRVRSGSGVELSRALSPAPSYSALSWLETSILFPAKFADISVKATAGQEDEREGVRREKLAIEEIRSLLAEMLEG